MSRSNLSDARLKELEWLLSCAVHRMWPPYRDMPHPGLAIERLKPDSWRNEVAERAEEEEATERGLSADGADLAGAPLALALAAARARLRRGLPLSRELTEVVLQAIRNGGQSPRPIRTNYGRDQVIAWLVDLACDLGLNLTRNRNPSSRGGDDAPSACSAVARALGSRGLHLTEDGIEKIWRRNPPDR